MCSFCKLILIKRQHWILVLIKNDVQTAPKINYIKLYTNVFLTFFLTWCLFQSIRMELKSKEAKQVLRSPNMDWLSFGKKTTLYWYDLLRKYCYYNMCDWICEIMSSNENCKTDLMKSVDSSKEKQSKPDQVYESFRAGSSSELVMMNLIMKSHTPFKTLYLFAHNK